MEEGGPEPSLVEHPFMLYHVLPSGMGVLLEGVLGARSRFVSRYGAGFAPRRFC